MSFGHDPWSTSAYSSASPVVQLAVTSTCSAAYRARTRKALTAACSVTAYVVKRARIRLIATSSVVARIVKAVANFWPTRGDKPNWNQCARCLKPTRPNKLLRQMEYVGQRQQWTGLYVCNLCLDDPHPQKITPRTIGGDPRPVPNARPRRG